MVSKEDEAMGARSRRFIDVDRFLQDAGSIADAGPRADADQGFKWALSLLRKLQPRAGPHAASA